MATAGLAADLIAPVRQPESVAHGLYTKYRTGISASSPEATTPPKVLPPIRFTE